MAGALTDSDVDRIAESVAMKMLQQGGLKNFYIEPEQHYQDHIHGRALHEAFDPDTRLALKEMAMTFRQSRSKFSRWAIRIMVLGALALFVNGLINQYGHVIDYLLSLMGKK